MSDIELKEFNHEFSQLTKLAVAQLIVAISDADDSMNELTEVFTEIIQQGQDLQNLVKQLLEIPDSTETVTTINRTSNDMNSNIEKSMIAFQFYDRMCQRFEHTILCLKELSRAEDSSKEQIHNRTQTLFNKIYDSYTMQEERQLYDEILKHPDFEAALAKYRKTAKSNDEDIELF